MHFIEKIINYIQSNSEMKENNSDISYYTISHHFTFCHVREIHSYQESIKIVSIILPIYHIVSVGVYGLPHILQRRVTY